MSMKLAHPYSVNVLKYILIFCKLFASLKFQHKKINVEPPLGSLLFLTKNVKVIIKQKLII